MIDPRSPPGLDDGDVSLASLFSAERRHPGPPPGAEARVRSAIAASITAAAVGSGSAAASGAVASSTSSAAASTAALSGSSAVVGTSLAAKLSGAGVVVAALAATGGGALFVSSYEAVPSTTAVIAAAPERPAPPPGLVVDADPTIATETPSSTTTTADTTTAATTPTRSSTIDASPRKARVTAIDSAVTAPVPVVAPVVVDEPARVAALAAERRQLGFARAALTAGNGRQALALLEGHTAAWPTGQLVEEREALVVLSLARLGRTADARAAATTFRARYPKSLFVDAIDRAVGR